MCPTASAAVVVIAPAWRSTEVVAELIQIESLTQPHRLLLGNGIVGLAEGACRYWVTNDVEVDAATLAAQVSQLAWAGLRGVG